MAHLKKRHTAPTTSTISTHVSLYVRWSFHKFKREARDSQSAVKAVTAHAGINKEGRLRRVVLFGELFLCPPPANKI